MRARLGAAGILLLGCVLSTAGEPEKLTASSVQRLIDHQGPRATLEQLFARSENALADGIATGGAAWLRVAAQLRPVSDGASAEVLCMAIQEALPRNPTGVLGLVHRGVFTARDACGMYGFGQIEDQRPTAVLLGLVDGRIRAVRGVRGDLANERDACLSDLSILRSRLAAR